MPMVGVVHLQPAKWVNDWLVIGDDKDGDGCGDPVQQWKKPNLPSSGNFQPNESDDPDLPTISFCVYVSSSFESSLYSSVDILPVYPMSDEIYSG